jgi:hypothetical protein
VGSVAVACGRFDVGENDGRRETEDYKLNVQRKHFNTMTRKSSAFIIFGSVTLALGVALGWFSHGWQRGSASSAADLPLATSSANAAKFSQPSAATLDERIQLTEIQLKQAQTNYAGIMQEKDLLSREKLTLEEARLQAEKAKAIAEQRSGFFAAVASKLANEGSLEVPQTVAEASVFAGQLHRMSMDFSAKWGDAAPPQGTPEFAEYQQEMDALATESADLIKFFGANKIEDIVKKSSSIAHFQSLQFYGSLGLNDAQWRQLDGTLNRYYTEGFNRNLQAAARPETGVDAWQEQRTTLSQQAYNEVRASLTPQQRSDFERLYGPNFFWNINIGPR